MLLSVEVILSLTIRAIVLVAQSSDECGYVSIGNGYKYPLNYCNAVDNNGYSVSYKFTCKSGTIYYNYYHNNAECSGVPTVSYNYSSYATEYNCNSNQCDYVAYHTWSDNNCNHHANYSSGALITNECLPQATTGHYQKVKCTPAALSILVYNDKECTDRYYYTGTPSPLTAVPTIHPYEYCIEIDHCDTGPTNMPTTNPTPKPTTKPTLMPTIKPTQSPSPHPTLKPTNKPTIKPTTKPTNKPSLKNITPQPSSKHHHAPTSKPTNKPSSNNDHITHSPTMSPSSAASDNNILIAILVIISIIVLIILVVGYALYKRKQKVLKQILQLTEEMNDDESMKTELNQAGVNFIKVLSTESYDKLTNDTVDGNNSVI